MGKQSKGLSGAASGAAAGTSIMPGWGTAIGAGLGFILGESTGGDAPEQVKGVDPAFVNSLYNQSIGTEKTAADMKMKAAFDQTLAQQVAAARAARGVNPALLQRNVSRLAAEQGAKATGQMAEANLQNQADARTKYLQALSLNQNADKINAENMAAADARDSKQLGSLINSVGAIGSTFATAAKGAKPYEGKNAVKEGINTKGLTLSDAPQSAPALNSQYTLGAKQEVPQYDENAFNAISKSDKNAKTKIKREDMVVVSDERQKDLIKNESLPANGNMQQQNMQAMQPQGGAQVPPMGAFAQPALTGAPAPAAPLGPTPNPAPAPVPASQTAMAQANASMSKGGRIDDLQMKQVNLPEIAEGPSQDEIVQMGVDAKNRQRRDIFGRVIQSDAENYQANLARWYAKQAEQRAEREKQLGEVNKTNAGINSERMARLSKFYTGNSNTNTNDIMANYMPKNKLADAGWGAAQGAVAERRAAGTLQVTMPNGQMVQVSDERSKDEIAPQSKVNGGDFNPKSFLDKLNAYSFEYKQSRKGDENAGEGRRLGVMAQELELAGPVGKSMVETDPKTGIKQVDFGRGFGAILAAQAHLNERLSQIESKKKK